VKLSCWKAFLLIAKAERVSDISRFWHVAD